MDNNLYKVGIYIRLSREDDDKILESESIINQRSLLLQYINENNYTLIDEYVDDGYSGTNFDRPEFNRLIKDIELGRINMVLTKDMSRLGRDYIGTGNLIEKYFPEHNVRYIAVTDNIDTYIDNANNDIAPFKSIMNDMYAKDISKKIRSSLRAKQKEGKFVGGRPPFGYMVDQQDKNHLIINKEQAKVVKKIYDMSLNGLSFYKIALELNEEKIRPPADYYNFVWNNNTFKTGLWNSKTISDILKNAIYTGDMVQNKRNKINYKVKKIVKNKPEDYIIVKNMHEPIIDRNTFEIVQKRLPKNVGRCEKKENHLFDGLLYCADCGHRISITPRRKSDNRCYTICNYYRTYTKMHVCTTHINNYDELEKVLIGKLKDVCSKYMDKIKIKNSVDIVNLRSDNKDIIKNEINLLNNEIDKLNNNLDMIYLDKLNNVIDENQYKRIKINIEKNINNKIKRLDELNMKKIDKQIASNNKKIEKYIKNFLEFNIPSRELIVNLVDRIDVYQDKRIDMHLAFNNN